MNLKKLPCPGRTVSQKLSSEAAAAFCASMHLLWSCKKPSSTMLSFSFTEIFFLDSASHSKTCWFNPFSKTSNCFFPDFLLCEVASQWIDDLLVMSFRALRLSRAIPPFFANGMDVLDLPSAVASKKWKPTLIYRVERVVIEKSA